MAASQALVSAEILDAWPLARHRRLLDVGGGDGSFLIAAGRTVPHLELVLFDLPPVAAIARQRFLAAGLAGRARAYGGNLFEDRLPENADLVTLNRVLHDHDDSAAMAILRAVRSAIAPDGTLLVTEPMADTPGAKASGDAYFGFYLLAMGQGRPRTAGEIAEMLACAGFGDVRPVATNTPLIARMISARPR
jgi:demethylspheroidene O-methyltransferase